MEISNQTTNSNIEYFFKGNFTFSDNPLFKEILDSMGNSKFTQVTFNLSGIGHIDSSALGMLLLAKDSAKKHNLNLYLKSPQGKVKLIFDISKFYNLFNIID